MTLIVNLKQGSLKGKENVSVLTSRRFYTFQGIPYAKPPVEDLRFQAPQPSEKWLGIYDATYERDICSQHAFLSSRHCGKEDCLYLNITTPQKPSEIETPNAVIVFIHGGRFCIGSGSEKDQSGDFLMERDIILVTFNFRLHILGFLNLGIPDCPGNAGLKDQVLALKWVKENIAKFGGDPENITLYGLSSGAAAVHFHMISPLSKGLFHKAIMQGGSAYRPRALVYNPYEIALKAGKILGFEGNDRNELLNFLKQRSAFDLSKASEILRQELREKYPFKCSNLPFIPSVEEIKDGAFLPDLPENLSKTADPLPIIFGVVENEGEVLWRDFDVELLPQIQDNIEMVLKYNFKIDCNLLPALSEKVKQHYFGDKKISLETLQEATNLFTDIFFYHFYESIEFVTKSSFPAFIYEFVYVGGLNLFKNRIKGKSKKIKGAFHADETGYIFHLKSDKIPILNDTDFTVLRNMTAIWTNFAKYGNPTPDSTWKPSTSDDPFYLRINNSLKLIKGRVYGERLQFLKSLLDSVVEPNDLL